MLRIPEKDFDCVRMTREIRDELYRAVKGMTPEQRIEFIRHRAERVRADLDLPEAVRPGFTSARTQ